MIVNIFVYGSEATPIVNKCLSVLKQSPDIKLVKTPQEADVAIAPLLSKKLSLEEIQSPLYGTLVFHPSLLPRHRGRDAIKWAFRLEEAYTGATWFWADEGYDTGDICETEVLAIKPDESPREFYERAVIPSAIRMLSFILQDLTSGHIRRRPQRNEHASYEPPIKWDLHAV